MDEEIYKITFDLESGVSEDFSKLNDKLSRVSDNFQASTKNLSKQIDSAQQSGLTTQYVPLPTSQLNRVNVIKNVTNKPPDVIGSQEDKKTILQLKSYVSELEKNVTWNKNALNTTLQSLKDLEVKYSSLNSNFIMLQKENQVLRSSLRVGRTRAAAYGQTRRAGRSASTWETPNMSQRDINAIDKGYIPFPKRKSNWDNPETEFEKIISGKMLANQRRG